MIGLILKDWIVFKKRFSPLYRIACGALLALAVLLLPGGSVGYIGLCLPMVGVAFLTEIVKVDEQSEWKDYLPVLPITNRDVVTSRYMFMGALLAAVSAVSFAACAVSAVVHQLALAAILPNYVLGVWFGILLLCVAIPSGYFFKNEICTGAMMWCLIPLSIVRGTGIDLALVRTGSPLVFLLLPLSSALMLCASHWVSLWVYTARRDRKINAGNNRAA